MAWSRNNRTDGVGVLRDGEVGEMARKGDIAELDRSYMDGDTARLADGEGAVGNAEKGSTSDRSGGMSWLVWFLCQVESGAHPRAAE